MGRKVSNFMKAFALGLVCVLALSLPAYAGQGRGRGMGRGNGRIRINRDSTPGVPTSIYGRGRNYNPGTPRGRYTRPTYIITTRKRRFSVPRRVKRGRYIYPGTRRGSIY